MLRYVSDRTDTKPLLRLIVQSRNLTFDRSWDISLKLEGVPSDTNRRRNIPLGKLLDALQTSAVCTKPMSRQRKKLVESLVADARQTDWELPEGFDELRFHVLGLDSKPWLPERSRELAIISPFVRPDALRRLAQTTDRARLLLARSEELENVPPDVLALFESTRILTEQAASGEAEDDLAGGELGLHAKVYVQQRGWDTHIILGSANATDRVVTPGLNTRSLELMAELIGKRSRVGSIDDLFTKDGLGDLLMDYSPQPALEADRESIESEKMLERVRGQLADAAWLIHCSPCDDGWALSLSVDRKPNVEAVELRVWPLTVSHERSVAGTALSPAQGVELGTFATEEVTALLGFHLRTGNHEVRFAVEAKVDGMPADRDNAIDRLIIRNRDGFVRYLLLLLGSVADEGEASNGAMGSWGDAAFGVGHAPPLFDMLACAYARDPMRVAPIARLIRRLSVGREASVIPDDFFRIWKVFEQALIKDGIHVDAI